MVVVNTCRSPTNVGTNWLPVQVKGRHAILPLTFWRTSFCYDGGGGGGGGTG